MNNGKNSLYRAAAPLDAAQPAQPLVDRGPRQDESKISDRFDRHGQDVIEGRRASAKTAAGAVVIRGKVRA